MQSEIISDWISICAAGQSILGEPIDDAMVQAAADNYDPRFYTAMIWPHHPCDETGAMFPMKYCSDLTAINKNCFPRRNSILIFRVRV